MKKWGSLLLCAILIGFLAASPAVIAGGLGKNTFRIREERQEKAYKGTIEVWHVVGFKTAAGSGYRMIREMSDRFEKNTPAVFVSLTGLTVEEARERLQKGEHPDVISYPLGFLPKGSFLDLPVPKDYVFGGKSARAIAYMADSYVLAANEALLQQWGVQRDFGDDITRELLEEAGSAAKENGEALLSMTDCEGLNPREILKTVALRGDREPLGEELFGESTGAEEFREGKAVFYLCPYAEYKRMSEEGTALAAYFCSAETDALQLISEYDSGDQAKNEMLLQYAEEYFRERFQRGLEETGMLPCIRTEGVYDADAFRAKTYRDFCEKARNGVQILFPPTE